jgi:asparagine synthase (glutamine-hydrolysing)
MCGIAGIMRFTSKEVNAVEIKKLTDVIAHRGPDGEGCWIHPNKHIGLGHRRLSILDLSEQGSQPMHYADDVLSIVFNGEIYNFIELKQELKQKGYDFKSESDTEVLLASYHCWGKNCLTKFNGFWSFALWDDSLQELWLVRDRFGIKPLYYTFENDFQIVFGSETKQFNQVENFKKKANDDIISYAIANSWGLEGYGKTIFDKIEQVKPGHWISVKIDKTIKEYCWWDTSENLVDINSTYKEQVNSFQNLLEDSILLRLRSDVPIGTALSGGLDSSSIYSMIKKISSSKHAIVRSPNDWQKAFIATFPNTSQDEELYAREVVGGNVSSSIFFDISTDNHFIENLLKSITHYDLISATPLNILDGVYGKMNENGIKVSLDGHGVDEMLYGYPFLIRRVIEEINKFENLKKDDIVSIYDNMFVEQKGNSFYKSSSNKNVLQKIYQRIISKFKASSEGDISFFSQEHFAKTPEFIKKISNSKNGPESLLYNAFHFDVLPSILRNFDMGSMKNSVEVRMPFMDYRIVTFLFSLPIQSKIGNGMNKRILRDAMKNILIEKIRVRKSKIGLNAPLKNWFTGDLKEIVIDEVNSSSFLNSNWWNGKGVNNFVNNKYKKNDWSDNDCTAFWPILNAHLLLNK